MDLNPDTLNAELVERACSYMDEEAGIGKMIVVLDCNNYRCIHSDDCHTQLQQLCMDLTAILMSL
jgi:hypothetical protein